MRATRDLDLNIKFSLISSRDVEINGLDSRTDGQQSDPKRVLFFPFEIRNLKNIFTEAKLFHQININKIIRDLFQYNILLLEFKTKHSATNRTLFAIIQLNYCLLTCIYDYFINFNFTL